MSFIPSYFHLQHHRGKLLGLVVGAILFAFWGGVVGVLAGAAFD
jgi:hypothetical protein